MLKTNQKLVSFIKYLISLRMISKMKITVTVRWMIPLMSIRLPSSSKGTLWYRLQFQAGWLKLIAHMSRRKQIKIKLKSIKKVREILIRKKYKIFKMIWTNFLLEMWIYLMKKLSLLRFSKNSSRFLPCNSQKMMNH